MASVTCPSVCCQNLKEAIAHKRGHGKKRIGSSLEKHHSTFIDEILHFLIHLVVAILYLKSGPSTQSLGYSSS